MSAVLATSFYQPDHLSFYNVVLFIHISAAIIAFGVTFAYPIFGVVAERTDKRSLPYLHRVQGVIGQRLITTAATVVLAAGIYLVAAGNFGFGDAFVSAGIVIVVVLLGLVGALLTPTERKLLAIAQRDVGAASGGDEIVMSAEYGDLLRRMKIGGAVTSLLVLAAVFVMVIKPG